MTPPRLISKALLTQGVAASFASKIPTVTPPINDGVHTNEAGDETLEVYPFGLGANNTTFDFQIIGWRRTSKNPGAQWVNTVIVECTATLSSAQLGCPAGGSEGAIPTQFYADTITVNKGVGTAPSITGDAGCAVLICDITGFDRWEFSGSTTSSATNYNAEYCSYGGANG